MCRPFRVADALLSVQFEAFQSMKISYIKKYPAENDYLTFLIQI